MVDFMFLFLIGFFKYEYQDPTYVILLFLEKFINNKLFLLKSLAK